jgi:hypothetical protein
MTAHAVETTPLTSLNIHRRVLNLPHRVFDYLFTTEILSEAMVLPATTSCRRRCVRGTPVGLQHFSSEGMHMGVARILFKGEQLGSQLNKLPFKPFKTILNDLPRKFRIE